LTRGRSSERQAYFIFALIAATASA
jgi:hypothetical protein